MSCNDTDIFSSRLPGAHSEASQINNEEATYAAQRVFTRQDTPVGVLRHANFVETRYCCLFLTGDNLSTFLSSLDQTKAHKLLSAVRRRIKAGVILKMQELKDVEKLWTLADRGQQRHDADPTVLADLAYTTYLDAHWHIIRELHVIALDGDAWKILFQCGRRNCLHAWPSQRKDTSAIMPLLEKIRNESPGQSLLAAIQRNACCIQYAGASTDFHESHAGATRDLVHHLYKLFKKGLREPEESFLRVSKILEQRDVAHSDVFSTPTALGASCDGCVLISSSGRSRDPMRSAATICAYFTQAIHLSPNTRNLPNIIEHAFQTRCVHHTTQNNGTSGLLDATQKRTSSTPWNIEGTYGPSMHGLYFLKMLRSYTNDSNLYIQGLPVTQHGLYRSLTDLVMPWTDGRLVTPDKDRSKLSFITYKVALRRVLQDRTRERTVIRCCAHCADINPLRISHYCVCNCVSPWLRRVIHDGDGVPHEPPERLNQRDSERRKEDLHWYMRIGSYPFLNKPFQDIEMLYTQADAYVLWEKRFSRRIRSTRTSKKPLQND